MAFLTVDVSRHFSQKRPCARKEKPPGGRAVRSVRACRRSAVPDLLDRLSDQVRPSCGGSDGPTGRRRRRRNPPHLAEHVVVAGFLDVGYHHFLGVGFGVGAGLAELFGRPQAEQPVAPGGRLELDSSSKANLRSKPSSRSFMLLMAILRMAANSFGVNMGSRAAQTKSRRRGQYASTMLQCGICAPKAVDVAELPIEQSVAIAVETALENHRCPHCLPRKKRDRLLRRLPFEPRETIK